MGFLMSAVEFFTPKPTSTCLFLQSLHHDIRFQIYTYVALSDSDNLRTYDILDPQNDHPYPLTHLRMINKTIREEIDCWYTQNTSWVTRAHGQIYATPRITNARYYLRWTEDIDSSFIPSNRMLTWHRFCFENPRPSTIGHLVIDFQLLLQYAPSTFCRMFAEPYRIESARNGYIKDRVLPIAASFSSVEIVFRADGSAARLHPGVLLRDWLILWREIGQTQWRDLDKGRQITFRVMHEQEVWEECVINIHTDLINLMNPLRTPWWMIVGRSPVDDMMDSMKSLRMHPLVAVCVSATALGLGWLAMVT